MIGLGGFFMRAKHRVGREKEKNILHLFTSAYLLQKVPHLEFAGSITISALKVVDSQFKGSSHTVFDICVVIRVIRADGRQVSVHRAHLQLETHCA